MGYVFGPIVERFDSISVVEPSSVAEDGKLRLIIQGGRYAVFSYPRPADDRDLPLMQRMLSRYVFQEWIPMNHKVSNTMGFTYERFTPERVYLYLPIKSGMENGSELHEQTWSLAQWAHRIDELIDIDLSTDVLAALEGYSTKNYVDVFSMYYGVSPTTYIRRRRLYLAGEAMRSDESGAHRDEILAKYRFSSCEQYCRMREKELNDDSQDAEPLIAPDASVVPDLEAYYESNKERVAFTIRKLQDFRILGHSIEASQDGRLPDDLMGRVLYWFMRTFPGFDRLEPFFTSDGAKMFIWADEPQSNPSSKLDSASDEVSRYYVAHILKSDLGSAGESAVETACRDLGGHAEVIPGGCYAVFRTVDDLESYSLEDAFLLLTRCAFGGWIKDNRWRVDFSRRTFVVWRDRKMYFLVPTVG